MLCAQWDKGYRPPDYADYPLDAARLELARYYVDSRDLAQAKRHLLALKDSKRQGCCQPGGRTFTQPSLSGPWPPKSP